MHSCRHASKDTRPVFYQQVLNVGTSNTSELLLTSDFIRIILYFTFYPDIIDAQPEYFFNHLP